MSKVSLESRIEKLLKENYGINSEIKFIKKELRLHGINYLIEAQGESFYLKCSTILTLQLVNILGKVSSSKAKNGDFYIVRFIKTLAGTYGFEYTFENTKYIFVLSSYIHGLTRYKDMYMHHLNIDFPQIIGNFHKYLASFNLESEKINSFVDESSYKYRKEFAIKNFDIASLKLLEITGKDTLNMLKLSKPNLLSLNDTRRTLVHGDLGNNTFLDSNNVTVMLDLDGLHLGSPIEDFSRLLASLSLLDNDYYLCKIGDVLASYNKTTGFDILLSDLLNFWGFSLLFELIECVINFDKFSELSGKDEVKEWILKKTQRVEKYLSLTR